MMTEDNGKKMYATFSLTKTHSLNKRLVQLQQSHIHATIYAVSSKAIQKSPTYNQSEMLDMHASFLMLTALITGTTKTMEST